MHFKKLLYTTFFTWKLQENIFIRIPELELLRILHKVTIKEKTDGNGSVRLEICFRPWVFLTPHDSLIKFIPLADDSGEIAVANYGNVTCVLYVSLSAIHFYYYYSPYTTITTYGVDPIMTVILVSSCKTHQNRTYLSIMSLKQ